MSGPDITRKSKPSKFAIRPYSTLRRIFKSSDSVSDDPDLDPVNSDSNPKISSVPDLSKIGLLSFVNMSTNNSITQPSTYVPSVQAPSASIQTPSVPIVNPADIFNSLRIPDAIKDLPRFDGNPRLLHEFLNNVEEILTYVRPVDGTPYSKILLRAIRNKIEGQANEVLNMYGTPLNWEDIKSNLILHYSDKRTETSLIRDLHTLRQGTKTIQQFYSEIVELQATMYNNILIHEFDPSVIQAKKELFAEMCLNTFLTGLKEPLGSTIRAMRPGSLAEALSYCIKEQNISYMKIDLHPNQSFHRKISAPQSSQRHPHPFPHKTFPRSPPFLTQQTRPFVNPRAPANNFNNPVHRFNSYQFQPFNNFNKPVNRYNPNQFQPSNQHWSTQPRTSRPEPMDTSSGHTNFRQPTAFRPQPRFFSNNNNLSSNTHQGASPKFVSEELFNVDQLSGDTFSYSQTVPLNDHYQQQLDQYYPYSPQNDEISHQNHQTEDDANFPTPASKTQQVT